MKLADIAANLGKGIFAGVAGTAAMTVSSTVEARLRGRGASSTPARAAAKILGVEPVDEGAKARFSNLVHWGYGIGWGGVRGLIAASGLSWPAATTAHFALVWGAEQVMLPALGVTPPLTRWGMKEVAVDALHHMVYTAATPGLPRRKDLGAPFLTRRLRRENRLSSPRSGSSSAAATPRGGSAPPGALCGRRAREPRVWPGSGRESGSHPSPARPGR